MLGMAVTDQEPLSSVSAQRALFALLLLLPIPSLGTAAGMFWWPELPLGKALFFGSKVWLVALPLIWLRFVDREPLSWSPARKGGFRVAAGLGFAISLIIVVAYAIAMHFRAIDPAQVVASAAKTGLNHLPIYIGAAIFWVTLNSILEEYVWRWFVFRKFETLFGSNAAVIAAGLGFTAHHVVALAAQFSWPITLLASLGVFVGGTTWSWLYSKYRSVWPGYVSHAIVDIAIFVIGYRLIFGGG